MNTKTTFTAGWMLPVNEAYDLYNILQYNTRLSCREEAILPAWFSLDNPEHAATIEILPGNYAIEINVLDCPDITRKIMAISSKRSSVFPVCDALIEILKHYKDDAFFTAKEFDGDGNAVVYGVCRTGIIRISTAEIAGLNFEEFKAIDAVLQKSFFREEEPVEA